GHIAFETNGGGNGTGGAPERMRLDIDGDLGIGVTNPTSKLHVAGQVDVSGNKIINLLDPTAAQDAASKAYVDARVASGTGFTEADPQVGILQATKWCVGSADGSAINCDQNAPGGTDNLGNHTATQALSMANFKVTNLATPTAAADAVTKAYVDSLLGTSTVQEVSTSSLVTLTQTPTYTDVTTLTVTSPGKYLVLASGVNQTSVSNWDYFASICTLTRNGTSVDGSQFYYGDAGATSSVAYFTHELSSVEDLVATDVLKVRCSKSSPVGAQANAGWKLRIVPIGGGGAGTGGSTKGLAVGASTTNLPNSTVTDIVFSLAPYNNDFGAGAWTSNKQFTVPAGEAGWYSIAGYAYLNVRPDTKLILYINVNGSSVVGNRDDNPSATTQMVVSSTNIYLSAGDVIKLTAQQLSGSAAALSDARLSLVKFSGGDGSGGNDNLGNHTATQSIVSDTHNTDDLGTTAIRWKDGWFAGTLTSGDVYTGTVHSVTDGRFENGETNDYITLPLADDSFRFFSNNVERFSVSSTGVATASSFAGSGASLTGLNASNLSSGTVPTARLGTGTANATTYLRGDGSWATPAASLPTLTSALLWIGNGSNVATAVALSGDATVTNAGVVALTANSVASAEITDSSVASADIAVDTIVAADIATGGVATAEILDNTIVAADIAADAITASELATSAVTTTEILDSTITSADIAADTIVAADIAADAVGIVELSATGTASSTTYLRGDNTWAAPVATVPQGVYCGLAIATFCSTVTTCASATYTSAFNCNASAVTSSCPSGYTLRTETDVVLPDTCGTYNVDDTVTCKRYCFKT
ncbi:MAG: hypothetical protein NW216_00495, partial [Hyphomicrobium sp.]|nr:hypothetical protein [Hyphomicrobium sp.]